MDELDLIRSFRAGVPGPSVAATAQANHAWRGAKRRRPGRWVPHLAAVTAAAAALALLVATDGRGLGASSAQAAETLRQAAIAVRGLTRGLEPGEYWYTRSRTAWTTGVEGKGGAYTVLGLEVREEWTAADGMRRWTTRQAGPIRFPSERDRDQRVCQRAGKTHSSLLRRAVLRGLLQCLAGSGSAVLARAARD